MEKLMQYVWQHRLVPLVNMVTVENEPIEIINPGMINHDSGPDFFNADIKINGQRWIGDIEIHVRASDWKRHGHQNDPAYDSVVLHIVEHDDVPVFRTNGERIPQMELKCAHDLHIHYNRLVAESPFDLTCAKQISSVPKIYLHDWLSALAYQRLQQKADAISQLAERMGNDWNSAAYVFFARSLGFGTNAEPFERLARSSPLPFLRRHSDNILAVEAILFGQAGFLNKNCPDGYFQQLQREYEFYSKKFGLRKPESLNWKMSRMRPQNFPFRRIAYLAAMIEREPFSPITYHPEDTLDDIREKLNHPLSGFWSQHYTFDSAPMPYPITMSRASLDIIIINAVIPLLYAWGTYASEEWMINQAIDYLHEMKPEDNKLVRTFTQHGILCPDAFTSQAIIQLRRNYCERRLCLACRFGHRILSHASIR